MGFGMGVIIGLLIDFFIGKQIGITAIMLGTTGIMGAYLDKSFSKENRFTIMIMVICTTIIYEIGNYLLTIFSLGVIPEIEQFTKITVIETIYNTIITIIIYPILQKYGGIIETIYKKKYIATRYF